MRRLIIGAVLFALPTTTIASGACQVANLVPPARFTHGPVSAIEMRVADPEQMCGKNIAACTLKIMRQRDRAKMKVSQIIVLPKNTYRGCTVAELRFHERAHVRGWPADHPR